MATGAVLRKGEGSGTYTYSSQPRVVQEGGKYRESDSRPSNIMHDRRIVRGNTYALHSLPASSQPNPLELQRQQESKRRVMARKRVGEHLRIHSPPPVNGRKHIDIQTELYLEEITDKVEETDVCTQTDAFLDRPPTPLFIPAKTGMDVATQIEDGDLFDFDLEVKPILEVLVGKTVEQALLEVMEEEELASLREQQRIFEENRNAELVEMQRLEEQERRSKEEKERRMMQQRQALIKEKETAEKVSARAFAQSYLSDLVPAVFTRLSNGGFFYDPIEREIEATFMPWLMNETETIVNKHLVARQLLDVILRELVKKKLGIADSAAKVAEEATGSQELKEHEGGEEKKEAEMKEEDVTVDASVEGEGKSEQVVDKKPETQDSASKPEEPATQESEPKPEEPTTQESKPEEPKPEEPATQESKSEESKPEEPTTQESKPEEPKSEEPANQELKPEEEKPEEPATQETKPEESKPEAEETKPEEPNKEEPKPEEPVTEELKPEEPVTEEPKSEEPSSEDQMPAQDQESNLEDKPQDNQ